MMAAKQPPLRRILVINPLGGLGGAERSLLDFVASARNTSPELEFHVLLFADGPLASHVRNLGASVSVLALPSRLHILGDSGLLTKDRRHPALRLLWALLRATPALVSFTSALRQEIIRRKPDIVHTNGMKAHLLSGLALPRNIRLVWHMHDFLSERPLARRALRLTYRRASAVIAISTSVAEDTHRVLPHIRIVTILNAVDVNAFTSGDANGSQLDALSGMKPARDTPLRIGLIATYARWKGQDVFLRAAAELRSLSQRSMRFYVIGGPIYATDGGQFSSAELESLISHLGLRDSAGLIPFQQDLLGILRSLDIFVHASSRPEPFGRSIVEAMACGRPVVVAAAGGVGEIVQAERTGLTHAPGDVAGLAAALRRLADSPSLRETLGAAGRASVLARFSRERLGPALIALYRSLS